MSLVREDSFRSAGTNGLPDGWTRHQVPGKSEVHYRNMYTGEVTNVQPTQAHVRREKQAGSTLVDRATDAFSFYTNPFGRSDDTDSTTPVPEGHEVRYTARGQPYVVKIDAEEEEAALNEHKREDIPFGITMVELGKKFGNGIQLYFDFVQFLTITNLVLTILAFIPSIVNWREIKNSDDWHVALFSFNYHQGVRAIWMATNIVSIVVWFAFGPLYSRRLTNFFAKLQTEDFEDRFGVGFDRIEANSHYTKRQRVFRIFGAYAIFIFLILIGNGVSILLTYIKALALSKVSGSTTPIIMSLIISMVTVVFNFVFKKLTIKLTVFEKHKTWSGYRKHNTLKLFLFKAINVMILYLAQWLADNVFDFGTGKNPLAKQCVFTGNGEQFLFLIALDVFVMPLLFFIWGKIKRSCCQTNNTGEGSDESLRPEFDLAEEYLELMYRQFVVYLGMTTFPLITAAAFIGNIIQFYYDKYRMLYVCQRPKRTDSSLKTFLKFFLFLVAILATFTFPFGAMFVIGANTFNTTPLNNCALFSNNATVALG